MTLHTQYRKWWRSIGEVQLIGNIWVIVGSTPTSSSVGWDLTVPSEVTALTSASVHACSCQSLAEKEDRARRSRRWMVLLLLMGALLTANVAAGVKYNQPVGTKKVTMQQLFKIFGTHSSDVCHSLLFSLWLTAQSLSCSLQRKS